MGLFGKVQTEEEKREKDLEKTAKQQMKQDVKDRFKDLQSRMEQYRPAWDKNGVIQYKDEFCAILQRRLGFQLEFIVAYSDLTKEGYRLMTIDEGIQAGEGATGGMNSYYYFQKIQYVK